MKLTLCMIVKNEAHGIARTLESARPWIDRWCILDTGSTDGTVDVIKASLDDELTGTIYHAEFVDFATTRNQLLRLAAQKHPDSWLLLLDADDILIGGDKLRGALEELNDFEDAPTTNAYYVSMREQSTAWNSVRIVRAVDVRGVGEPREHEQYCDGYACAACSEEDKGWHYVGAVHEVLVNQGGKQAGAPIPGVTISHEPPPQSHEARRKRLVLDKELLFAELQTNPTPRARFYYALTLQRMGLGDRAIGEFLWRAEDRAGFWQERFVSYFEAGRLLHRQGDHERALKIWLKAFEVDPRRAESLVEIARHYLTCSPPLHGVAYLYARRAFELECPADALFANADVYTWEAASLCAQAAWYVQAFEVGEVAARQALERGPAALRDVHARNLKFYTDRKAQGVCDVSRACRAILSASLTKPRELRLQLKDGDDIPDGDTESFRGLCKISKAMCPALSDIEAERVTHRITEALADMDVASFVTALRAEFPTARIFDADGVEL